MVIRNVKETISDNRRCEACGAPLKLNPRQVGRLARFCNAVCRVNFHRGRRPGNDNEPALSDVLEVLAELRAEFPSYGRELDYLKRLAERHHKGGN